MLFYSLLGTLYKRFNPKKSIHFLKFLNKNKSSSSNISLTESWKRKLEFQDQAS